MYLQESFVISRNPLVDFGDVIFGEQNTQYIKVENKSALATKIFVKTVDGHTIPFVTPENLPKDEVIVSDTILFDEFLTTVSFKRSSDIDGYSSTKIQFSFVPIKLATIA